MFHIVIVLLSFRVSRWHREDLFGMVIHINHQAWTCVQSTLNLQHNVIQLVTTGWEVLNYWLHAYPDANRFKGVVWAIWVKAQQCLECR